MRHANLVLLMALVFPLACKRAPGRVTVVTVKSLDASAEPSGSNGTPTENSKDPSEETVIPPGTPDETQNTPDEDPEDETPVVDEAAAAAAALAKRAQEIHDGIVAALDHDFAKEKGQLWSVANMQLDSDFIVASPEGLWGLKEFQFPTVLDCDKSEADCEPNFLRKSCETDDDCTAAGTHCAPMDAMVKTLVEMPKKLCQGPSDRLINRFYNVMASANKELDVVSLSMPDGRFRIAMNNALALLSQKPNPPTVRFLFSGYNSVLPNALNPPQRIMDQIIADVKKISPATVDLLRMNLAWLANGLASWNHSKIIVADGNRALAGGHNMWDGDYLRPNPISDLSLEYRGEAAEKARDFVNSLWLAVVDEIGTSGTKVGRLPPHAMLAESREGARAIHIGRMGAFGTNPADAAIIALIDAAKVSLSIDQQDYFNLVASDSTLTRSFAFDALMRAAVRGVKIQMIQSNKFPIGGYGMVDPKKAYAIFVTDLTGRLVEEKKLSTAVAKRKACELIEFAPFRISAELAEWPNKGGPFGTHTKWIMADDLATYVGSQNLYPADLQEYGSIITDVNAVAKLKAEYWDKVWGESSSAVLPCP